MEAENKPNPIQHIIHEDENGRVIHTWVKGNKQIASVVVDNTNSRPVINFNINEKLVPVFKDEQDKDINALDEIATMSLYTGLTQYAENGSLIGGMTCSHNANLGTRDFLSTIQRWITTNGNNNETT